MCGIIALLLADHQSNTASSELYEGLNVLQHRGQDAAGIVTCGRKGRLYQCKGNGMVRDVFSSDQLMNLAGYMGIGHVRYPTAGSSAMSEAQPFYVNSPYGIVMAHNGNLTNATELRNFIDFEAHRHVNTDSDSELLLNIFANNLQKTGKFRINEEDIFTAIKDLYSQCRGGYACVMMLAGFGVIAFRDPYGIRPIVYGSRKSATFEEAAYQSALMTQSPHSVSVHALNGANGSMYSNDPNGMDVSTVSGMDYMIASESVALNSLGFDNFHDLAPGEAIIISRSKVTKRQLIPPKAFSPCIFEYVYFARPDSIIDGISVYKARLAMGEALADQVLKKFREANIPLDIDVVIPVPDTSRVAALQVSYRLNLLYREGFIKNRYVGRTFIMPGQKMRQKNVRRKLNAMALEFTNKSVLLVDDSIVRGTTSKEIVTMAREAGAKKVYFASCAPPIRYPNVYGIDMPTRTELVAHNRTESEIAAAIGADAVIFQDLADLQHAVAKFNPALQAFDVSVFNGHYITGDVNEEYLMNLEMSRGGKNKLNPKASMDQLAATETIGLHNNFKQQ